MTESQILDYLDSCEFPMLDNGYYYHADQQLKIYRNETDWLMILQVIQYHNHCYSIDGFTTITYKYGSAVSADQSFRDDSFFFPVPEQEREVFLDDEEDYSSKLNPLVDQIKIDDTYIPLEHDPMKYLAKGIELESKEKIRPWEVLRYITPEYSHLLWQTREQLAIPANYKEEITFSNWEHPDNIDTNMSDMKSFQEIAKCLALNLPFEKEKIDTKDSNTHWSNWPDGGTL